MWLVVRRSGLSAAQSWPAFQAARDGSPVNGFFAELSDHRASAPAIHAFFQLSTNTASASFVVRRRSLNTAPIVTNEKTLRGCRGGPRTQRR